MKLYRNRLFYLGFALILLTSCNSGENQSQLPTNRDEANSSQQEITLDKNFTIVMGQTIYVPIYSYIYHDNNRQVYDLTATLSIRNTDLTSPIVVTSVRYNDSGGKLVRYYLDRPIQLSALASTDFVIDRSDTNGDLGCNFIVEWVARTEVSEPIVEAVLIGSSFQQGISWISPGKVIKSRSR